MANTVLQVITDAMREIGALAQGETPSNSEASDALRKLNRIIDALALEKAFVYSIRRDTHALTQSVDSYTIGTGGTIDIPRPTKIESANCIAANSVTEPLNILTEQQWAKVRQKTASAPVPESLYNDYAIPLSTIRLHPVPSAAGSTLELFTWQQISQFATVNDNVTLAPGYERALMYILAFDLADEYGKPTPATLPVKAQQARQAIAEMNLGGAVTPPPQPGATVQQ